MSGILHEGDELVFDLTNTVDEILLPFRSLIEVVGDSFELNTRTRDVLICMARFAIIIVADQ